ncbi:MAG: galactose mutarotase [Bacteroidaceae bacterium]|nr:galactose mutarotase [Bacteroidaceae bacterium]MBQ2186803.1 galactose mutarotase [Bacteroidaceae bacterium]
MLTSCQSKPKEEAEQPTQSGLLRSNFQSEETDLYTLTNANGMEVCFTNFGGRIVSIMVPNKDGQLIDVCLGHDNIDDYIKFGNEGCNFGALIGRYGNRIGNAKFTLDGQEYQLIANNNMNSLHGGGPVAFHNRIWEANQVDNQTLEFTTTSPDGEDGYPGNISVKVTYKLGDDNSLAITYQGSTDKPTVLNLTNHCYFCLSGDPTKDALDEVLYLNANQYTPVDEYVLATGEIADVEGTPFDFRTPTRIGDRIDDTTNVQIKNGNGYDHNWILATNGDINAVAGTLYDPTSGVQMDMYTDQPGMQFYAGNFLDGSFIGKKGIAYPRRSALCFETQHYPDSPNHPEFPTTTLLPGEEYNTTTIYKFSVK